jgi:hypothetical protein
MATVQEDEEEGEADGVDICGGVSRIAIRDIAEEYGELVEDIGVKLLSVHSHHCLHPVTRTSNPPGPAALPKEKDTCTQPHAHTAHRTGRHAHAHTAHTPHTMHRHTHAHTPCTCTHCTHATHHAQAQHTHAQLAAYSIQGKK